MATRRFLTFLALSLWLLPLRGNSTTQNSAAAPPAISWHTTGEITLPFEYFQQHIYVTVSLNGRPGFVFMLDSGANRNILNLRTARQLGMKAQHLMQKKDIGFGNGLIYVAPESSVQASIDSVPIARTMSVMDLNLFERHFSHPTDGMLGYPFFEQFVVKLDFERKLLILLPVENFSYRGLGIRIPLKPSKDFVVMPVTVGNDASIFSKINVVVDSGSNMVLMLYERFGSQLKLEGSLTHAQPDQGFGLDGYYPMKRGTVHVFRIGDAEARNVNVNFLEKDQELGPARHIPGAIGNGILQSFQAVIFDVPQHQIIFELKPQPLAAWRRANLYGSALGNFIARRDLLRFRPARKLGRKSDK